MGEFNLLPSAHIRHTSIERICQTVLAQIIFSAILFSTCAKVFLQYSDAGCTAYFKRELFQEIQNKLRVNVLLRNGVSTLVLPTNETKAIKLVDLF